MKYYNGKLLNKFEPLEVSFANHKSIGGFTGGRAFEYISLYKKILLHSDDFGSGGGVLVGYSKVDEIELSNVNSSTNGKKSFTYYNFENKTKKGLPNIPNIKNGLILKEEVFNAINDTLMIKEFIYTNLSPIITYKAIKINRVSGVNLPCLQSYDCTPPMIDCYYDDKLLFITNASQFVYNFYSLNSEWNKIESIVTTEFFKGIKFSEIENYTYYINGNIKTFSKTDSKNQTLTTKYFYPDDLLTEPFMSNLKAQHRIGEVIKTENYLGTNLLSTSATTYKDWGNNMYLPEFVKTSKGTAALENRIKYEVMDNTNGNPRQIKQENGTSVVYIWGYGKTLPVAKIENATYAQIEALPGFGTGFNIVNALSAAQETSLRNLPNALVTTYTHIPLVGVSTITDPKGDKITYEYDAFNRLKQVKDKDGNILSENEYNYKP